MAHDSDRTAVRLVIGLGGGLVFAGSLVYFAICYAVVFGRPAETGASAAAATAVNFLLFTAFALHHSVFARTGFKTWLVTLVPPALERSTYVWIASLLFVLVCAEWRAVPGIVWALSGPSAWVLRGLQLAGVVFTLYSARHLDMLDLAGVRQALSLRSTRPSKLDDRGPYGIVRHPIYLAWLLLVWPTPIMNATRLVFAATSTAYLLAAIPFEERDLRRTFGQAYEQYARRVKHRLVPGVY